VNTIWLRLRAPFAAWRWLQAGIYRASWPVMPPSAAWGLVLNLAAIDTRGEAAGVSTGTDPRAPPLRIAVGTPGPSSLSTLYQQLHSYPVSAKQSEDLAAKAHGQKYHIAPVRRGLVVDADVVLGVQTETSGLLDRVVRGLAGELNHERYGLPFAGDNNLLIDTIEVLAEAPPCFWYERLSDPDAPRRGSTRLTVRIDRADSGRTESPLFAPTPTALAAPPEAAWVWTPHEP
jgi:CRISPR-associated protein Cas5t